MVAYAGLIVEGFDHEGSAAVIASKYAGSALGPITFVAGRIRGSAGRVTTGAANGWGILLDPAGASATYTKLLATFAWRKSGAGNSGQIMGFATGTGANANAEFNVYWNDAAKVISLRRGSTVIATGTTVLSVNTWYRIAIKVLIASGGTGSYELKINEITELGPTSSVQTSSAASATAMLFGFANFVNDFDDLVVQDWSVAGVDFFPGDVSVATAATVANGNYAQFTPLSSTNESNVDEATPDDDTTYNSDSVVGHRDSFTHDALPTNGTPYIVQVATDARKDDAGTRTMKNFLRESSTDYDAAAAQSLLDTYTILRDIWNSDPAGGAWTQAAIDAAEIGYKVQA